MSEDSTDVLEWNANDAVLKRCSKIIDAINESRYGVMRFDDYGMPVSTPEEYLTHLIGLYMEIHVELKETEKPVWKDLKLLRDKLRVNAPKPEVSKMNYWRKTVDELDDLQLQLRDLAKAHGFLANNRDDSGL